MRVPFDLLRFIDVLSKNRIGGHTRMHRNIHGGMPFYHAFGFTLQNRGTSPLFPGKPPENEMPLEVRKNLGHTEPLSYLSEST
jgi:hypothetical protein